MSKIDLLGKTVSIDEDGLVRVDGGPMFRRIVRGGQIFVQFCDRQKMRSRIRGTPYIEIPLIVLVDRLQSGDGQ